MSSFDIQDFAVLLHSDFTPMVLSLLYRNIPHKPPVAST